MSTDTWGISLHKLRKLAHQRFFPGKFSFERHGVTAYPACLQINSEPNTKDSKHQQADFGRLKLRWKAPPLPGWANQERGPGQSELPQSEEGTPERVSSHERWRTPKSVWKPAKFLVHPGNTHEQNRLKSVWTENRGTTQHRCWQLAVNCLRKCKYPQSGGK